ncbi:MAG: CPBP family intramembrane metalloprotease [Clostridiales bacterium]|nr:CPBP family intramembrane metalloprotease [Clostridiales bacterium]
MNALYGVKRDYRAVSYALCSAVVGVILMRIISYFTPSGEGYGGSLASDALFTIPVQLLFFFGVPFLVYKLYGKRSVKQVFEYSNFTGFKPYFLLALPLGFCVWVFTIGVSSMWQALLGFTGYNSASSSPAMPEAFNFGYFVVDVLLTALLPAVCEEFIMRGGFLTTAQKTFKTVGCVVLCGVAFGLFHQNVKQVFYTSLFGALAAFMTIKLKSAFPAMLMHFANNFSSVFFNYADSYDFALGGGFFDTLDYLGAAKPWALILVYVSFATAAGGIAFLMLYLRERSVIDKKMEVIKDSGFDLTNKRVVLMGEANEERVKELEMEKEVYGADYEEQKFKPSARDVMVIVALGVVTVLTTVFTYVWGFFY